MPKNWKRALVAVIVAGVTLVPAALLALWGFMSATATRLHPDARNVTSVAYADPQPWATSVAVARQHVRAHLAEQNLPGLSVAVGIGDDIVWAEGFGWADLDKRVPIAPETRFRIGTASIALTSTAVGCRLRFPDPSGGAEVSRRAGSGSGGRSCCTCRRPRGCPPRAPS